MSAGLSWAVEALVASALLMLLVLIVRHPVRRAFGPGVAYALWALPALRLMLPPLPESWHAASVAPVLRATEQVTVLFVEPIAAPAAAMPDITTQLSPQLVPALALLWLVGAAAFALWHGVAHYRFCARTLAGAIDADTIGGVRVIESASVSGPLAFGVWRRYVAFPPDVAERYDAEERDLALAHELGHHARGDLIANWLALAVLALHWFNPLAWRAFRAFRADQEMANDARVLAGMSPMRRHAYACAIVKTAHPATFAAVSTACHLNTIDDLKGRLRMLTTKRISRLRRLAGTATLALLTGSGLALTASGTAAAAAARDGVEQATGVELAALAQTAVDPVPPAAAVPPSTPLPPPPPPPTDGKPVKHRYKVVVMDGDKTMSERDFGDTPPDVQTRVIKRMYRRDKDGHVTMENFGPGVPPPPGVPGAPTVMMMRRDGGGQWFGPGRMPPMPIIESMNCSDSPDGKPVIIDRKDGKQRTIICINRIEKIAAMGAGMAANSKDIERNAYVHALVGLRGAKARMMASSDMGADERKQALAGIDTAIAEIESDLAKVK